MNLEAIQPRGEAQEDEDHGSILPSRHNHASADLGMN